MYIIYIIYICGCSIHDQGTLERNTTIFILVVNIHFNVGFFYTVTTSTALDGEPLDRRVSPWMEQLDHFTIPSGKLT